MYMLFEMSRTFLGIDLGTTLIKACVVDEHKRLLSEKELPHEALVHSPKHTNWHEQCPKKMLKVLSKILQDFELEKLSAIAISGQMHGVVLWNAKSLVNLTNECELDTINCSTLVTWMDGRCDAKFLESLPKFTYEFEQKLGGRKVSSGYGIATLAWMKSHGKLNSCWDRAGTLMDFFVCFLTRNSKVLMSTQNAEGWGYYENGDQWRVFSNDGNKQIPVDLLPRIVPPEHVVSITKLSFAKIPNGVLVFSGIGDLHSSLLSVLKANEAVIHVGTSAQVVFMIDEERRQNNNVSTTDTSHLRLMPYFGHRKLLVAASLNGGNALTAFIEQIGQWSSELFDAPKPAYKPKKDFLDKVLSVDKADQFFYPAEMEPFVVKPLFYGERHCPESGAFFYNWRPNITVDSVLREIARGTIRNLAEMMPEQLLLDHNIHSIRLINRAAQTVYKSEAIRLFKSLHIFSDDQKLSAAFGAAIFALQSYNDKIGTN